MVDQCKQQNDESEIGAMQEPLLLPREASPPPPASTMDGFCTVAREDNTVGPTTTVTGDNVIDTAAAPTQSSTPISVAWLGCCTLALVLVGLGVILLCALLPLVLYGILACIVRGTNHNNNAANDRTTMTGSMFLVLLFLQCLHLRCLWTSARYLSVMRTLVLPLRRLIFPLVPLVARIESIREHESTQYYAVPATNNGEEAPIFRKSVRRHYRRMQKIYQRQTGMEHTCVRAERNLVLRDVIPILWEHQQRTTQQSWPLEDFIKRVLVVTLVPDGILDLYYMDIPTVNTSSNEGTAANTTHCVTQRTAAVVFDESIPTLTTTTTTTTTAVTASAAAANAIANVDPSHNENDSVEGTPQGTTDDPKRLVCFQFSILQGNVLHWFMYFCRTEATRAGIWWHGALLAIHRGHFLSRHDDQDTQYWVNAQTHQRDSKLHAGYESANPTHNGVESHSTANNITNGIQVLEKIYPWGVTARQIPCELLEARLWDEDKNE